MNPCLESSLAFLPYEQKIYRECKFDKTVRADGLRVEVKQSGNEGTCLKMEALFIDN